MKKILFFVMVSLFATLAMASDWVPGVEVLTGHEKYDNRIFADRRTRRRLFSGGTPQP